MTQTPTNTRHPPPDGADEDIQETRGPSPYRMAVEETRAAGYRYRRQLAPWAVMGGVFGVGWTAGGTPTAGHAALVVAAGWVALLVAYALVRRRAGRWDRVYAAVAAGGAAGWLPAAAAAGAGGVAGAVLWLGGAVLALPWWVRHSEAWPDVTAEREAQQHAPPAPVVPAPEQPDPRIHTWGVYLGGRGKPLAGSRIGRITDFEYGWRAVGELRRGDHWTSVIQQIRAITSFYSLEDGRVFAEPIPGRPVHDFLLTVLTTNPLIRPRLWRGPQLDPKTGTFPVAVTGDGEILHFRLWTPGSGGSHGLVSGTTDSGKSRTLDLILVEAAHSDRLYPVVIDGNGGQSLPDWLDHVPQSAITPAEAKALLRWALGVMEARSRHLAKVEWVDEKGRRRKGRKSIDPTPRMPGIVIVIDEAHNLLGDEEIKRAVELLTQMGRKTAISVVLATQVASIRQLGNSNVIRDMVKSGTVIALRTGDRSSSGFVTDLPPPEPLHTLPKYWPDGSPTSGLGYVMTARLIRSRTIFVEDPFEWAQAAPRKTLDPVSAAVPVPTAGGGDSAAPTKPPATQPTPSLRVATSHGADVVDTVHAAVDAGTPADLPALVRATGLSPRAVKAALRQLQ